MNVATVEGATIDFISYKIYGATNRESLDNQYGYLSALERPISKPKDK